MSVEKKWEAGGFADMAQWLGWEPPTGPDGIWKHEDAGSYHDSIMVYAVLSYASRHKWLKANDDVEFTIRLMKQRLLEVCDLAHQALEKCNQAKDSKVDAIEKAAIQIHLALEEIKAVQFET